MMGISSMNLVRGTQQHRGGRLRAYLRRIGRRRGVDDGRKKARRQPKFDSSEGQGLFGFGRNLIVCASRFSSTFERFRAGIFEARMLDFVGEETFADVRFREGGWYGREV